MRNFRIQFLVLILLLAYGPVHAEGFLMGLEYESEKDTKTGITNRGLSVIPGWEFSKENLINRVEVLLEHNKDTSADSDGFTRKENKVFLRLRHDGEISDRVEYYVRGGVGRSFNDERNFNYAYVEPALVFKLSERWEWALAFRESNSIDGTAGEHVGKFITGANFDLDKNNEIELRYVQGSGDEKARSWLVEYVHRF